MQTKEFTLELESCASERISRQSTNSSNLSSMAESLPSWNYTFWGTVWGIGDNESLYQEFMLQENSLPMVSVVVIVGTLTNIFLILSSLNSDAPNDYKAFVSQRGSLLLPLWLYFYMIIQSKYPERFGKLCFKNEYVGDAMLLVYSVSFGTFMYGMTIASGCDESSPPSLLMCDDNVKFDSIIVYVVVSLMLPVVFKNRHTAVVMMCIVIEVAFIAIVVVTVDRTFPNILSVIIVFIVQSLVTIDYDMHSRRLFLLLLESRSIMHAKIASDNENTVMEMQSTELRHLIANVAHDLKTPLQALTFELTGIKGKGNDDSVVLLESICSFMLMIINRAIDYTKATSGIELKPTLETVNVKEVFEWVKTCVSYSVTTRDVPIVVVPIADDLCSCIITDRHWLTENMLCLVSNAQKFTVSGSIRIVYSLVKSVSSAYNEKVTIEEAFDEGQYIGDFTAEKSMVLIEVIDDGIGVPEGFEETIFKPGMQAHRRSGGTGLGMFSLSKRVESLGGTCGISARRDRKRGSRVWFTLPYTPDLVAMEEHPSMKSAATVFTHAPQPSSSPIRQSHGSGRRSSETNEESRGTLKVAKSGEIMLVEDSLLIQKTCSRLFLRAGIKIAIANNGLECVELVKKEPNQYKLLLMDVNMPVMDGLEATESIRQWESSRREEADRDEQSKILIVGVSANSDSISEQEALDAGMDFFISKPMSLLSLEEQLLNFNIKLEHSRDGV